MSSINRGRIVSGWRVLCARNCDRNHCSFVGNGGLGPGGMPIRPAREIRVSEFGETSTQIETRGRIFRRTRRCVGPGLLLQYDRPSHPRPAPAPLSFGRLGTTWVSGRRSSRSVPLWRYVVRPENAAQSPVRRLGKIAQKRLIRLGTDTGKLIGPNLRGDAQKLIGRHLAGDAQ